MFFNRTLAKLAASSENRSGSMGNTRDTWVVKSASGTVPLSTTVASNYVYFDTVHGYRVYKRVLKEAPVGAVLYNEYRSNWSGQEPVYSMTKYVKHLNGAWYKIV